MKVILIKYKDKPIALEQICELTTRQFLEIKREIAKNIESYESLFEHQLERIHQLEQHTLQLENTCKNLQHQINVITGVEEESEETE